MQYADIVLAICAALALAWGFDLATGRRGLFAALLVSGTGAVAGWFLAVRVFAVASMDDWAWVLWSIGASVIVLAVFFLFRNKR